MRGKALSIPRLNRVECKRRSIPITLSYFPADLTMQTNWLPLLDEFGAILNESGDVAFPQTARPFAELEKITTITPLAPYGLLAVQGPDSAKFLQGQLTCDVQAAGATQSTPGAYCTQKGRMLTSFQLLQRDESHYWLRMRADLLANTASTLGKFIVFSKAKLLVRDDIAGFGLHGPEAAALLQTLFGTLPVGLNGTVVANDALLLQRDAAGLWFECWLPATAASDFWQRCAGQCITAGTDFWRWLTIRAGFGEISTATAELFIPQMLNFHLNGAVNFKKGCYTGQEIIARTHYRGQVKRHVQIAQCEPELQPEAGSEVLGANGHAIGNVLDSVRSTDRLCELLVVVADSDPAAGAISIKGSTAPLTLLPLPYAIN